MANKTLEQMLNKFLPFAQKRMGFKTAPEIRFESDETNAQDPLGKTAYYEPDNSRITVYTVGRHPKDIMRSISHELVHHTQNGRGDFANSMTVGEQGYAQNDEHLREMEREAYEQGNLCFRDWEDSIKTHHNEVLDMWQKRNKKLNESVMKKFGYGNLLETMVDAETGKAVETVTPEEKEAIGMILKKAFNDPRRPLSFEDVGEAESLYSDDLTVLTQGGKPSELFFKLSDRYGAGRSREEDPYAVVADKFQEEVQLLAVRHAQHEGLGDNYDADFRDRLDTAQEANPEMTMPQIKAMLAGDSDPEQVETSPFEPKPVKGSGGERYKVGDTIKIL